VRNDFKSMEEAKAAYQAALDSITVDNLASIGVDHNEAGQLLLAVVQRAYFTFLDEKMDLNALGHVLVLIGLKALNTHKVQGPRFNLDTTALDKLKGRFS
jgi:hypothetical protein